MDKETLWILTSLFTSRTQLSQTVQEKDNEIDIAQFELRIAYFLLDLIILRMWICGIIVKSLEPWLPYDPCLFFGSFIFPNGIKIIFQQISFSLFYPPASLKTRLMFLVHKKLWNEEWACSSSDSESHVAFKLIKVADWPNDNNLI